MRDSIRVIVIDDSAFMRKSLSMLLESDPEIEVIATARDGREGIEKITQLKPDLVTLDMEMPRMDGLTALKIIMKDTPLPVLIVSSLTSKDSETTLEALSLGAVDFIPKNISTGSLNIVNVKNEIIFKVKRICKSQYVQSRFNGCNFKQLRKNILIEEKTRDIYSSSGQLKEQFGAVVIGVSTGGPYALLQIIPELPADFPVGIVIVQHMPPHFTNSLAERLNKLSKIEVAEAKNGDKFCPGKAFVAPGGLHLTFAKSNNNIYCQVSNEETQSIYKPSVDLTMKSAVNVFDRPLLGVIMTGMGKDGINGLKLIKKNNGAVIAQNEETCVVYGMPKEAINAGIADVVVPLEEITTTLMHLTKKQTKYENLQRKAV